MLRPKFQECGRRVKSITARTAGNGRLITKAASAADARALQHRRVSSSSFRPTSRLLRLGSLSLFSSGTHTHAHILTQNIPIVAKTTMTINGQPPKVGTDVRKRRSALLVVKS